MVVIAGELTYDAQEEDGVAVNDSVPQQVWGGASPVWHRRAVAAAVLTAVYHSGASSRIL